MKLQAKAKACNFIKKETLAQVFSCEFAKFLRSLFFTELRLLLHMPMIYYISPLETFYESLNRLILQTKKLTFCNYKEISKNLLLKSLPRKLEIKIFSGKFSKKRFRRSNITILVRSK